jgi:integrase
MSPLPYGQVYLNDLFGVCIAHGLSLRAQGILFRLLWVQHMRGAIPAEIGELRLVFADPRGNPLRGDGMYKYHWRPLLRRLGLPPVRLYDARHSAATMLLEAGVPMRVVQEVLGHSSMAVTADVYSHVTPAFKRQAAEALAAHLAQSRNSTESEGGSAS